MENPKYTPEEKIEYWEQQIMYLEYRLRKARSRIEQLKKIKNSNDKIKKARAKRA